MVYRQRLGRDGVAASVVVSNKNCCMLNDLTIKLERKIIPEDVTAGKLNSTAVQKVKKRGGKRSTTLTVSLEGAEALHLALTAALEDARRRSSQHLVTKHIMMLTHDLKSR